MAGRPDWDIWRGGELLPAGLSGRVMVFACEPEAILPEELALFQSWLSPDEEKRRKSFLFEKDRLLFGVSHALTRYALSLWQLAAGAPGNETAPGEWRFATEAAGKPRALFPAGRTGSPGPPCFSLSHTRGLAAAAVTAVGRLGVDVERIRRKTDALALAERFFAPEEWEELAALPDSGRRREHFTRLWTFKEAYLKALGTGLGKGLGSFAVKSDGEGAKLLWDRNASGESWFFCSFTLSADLILSLAAEGRERPEVQVWLGRSGQVWSGITSHKF
jgi:4'-phosphopantetheinyl transferase